MATAQQELAAKLAACCADGTPIHGSIIDTYKSERELVIHVIDKTNFRCSCWCVAQTDTNAN